MRQFNRSLASVSTLLDGEREELTAALDNLGTALSQVGTFVQENKASLGRNIKALNRVAKVLVKRRDELDQVLRTAPVALNNLALTYNPDTGTLDTNANVGNLESNIAERPARRALRAGQRQRPQRRDLRPARQPWSQCPSRRRRRPEGCAGRGPRLRAPLRSLPQRSGGGPMMRTRFIASLVLLGSLTLSACDFDVTKLPLPGGTDTGKDPIKVSVEFRDVLDLVPQSTVKVDEVSVGKVTDVELDGTSAKVVVELPNDVDLPSNAVAEIRQTSLLGEKFVQLAPPSSGATSGRLADGDVIPLERTGRNPEVEEVLGALSLILNGGGVAQLKTIAKELNIALDGREDAARSVLTQIKIFTTQLDENRGDIVNAIESLNRLAISARQQQGSIDSALDNLPSALTSLDRQTDDLVKMLQALNRLGSVGTKVIRASKASTIESFRQLQPVLTELANSGDAFVDAFNVFLTYPFVDEVVGRDPQVARNLHMGDYTNLSVRLELDLTDPVLPGIPCRELDSIPDDLPLADILDLPNLCDEANAAIQRCIQERTAAACAGLPLGVVNAVCQRVPVPGLCPAGGGGGGGGLPNLPNLPNLPGLGNGGRRHSRRWARRAPTTPGLRVR